MKIAVYSGTFDPLHRGHKAILKHLSQNSNFDAVYLVVSPNNPLKNRKGSDNSKARLKAAQKALAKYPELKTKIEDIEFNMPTPNYTIHTLDALKKREPNNSFTLIMGADNLANIRKWKDYQKILTNYGVGVFPRKGHKLDNIKKDLKHESEAFKIETFDVPLVNISSTEIREAISKGENPSKNLF